MSGRVTIELEKDDALVLCDVLASWRDDPQDLSLKNDGQKHALLGLLASLEKTLVEPFMPEYGDLVKKAEENLIEKYGQL